MSVYLIFKIAAVGILVSVINQILKQSDKGDYTVITSLTGLLIVLYWVIPYIADLFDYIQKLFQL